jgi:hypothetical protein
MNAETSDLTYYDILGIDNNFKINELRQATSEKIKDIQETTNIDKNEKQKQIDKLLDIFNVLSNDEERKKYDELINSDLKILSLKDQLNTALLYENDTEQSYPLLNKLGMKFRDEMIFYARVCEIKRANWKKHGFGTEIKPNYTELIDQTIEDIQIKKEENKSVRK